MADYVVVDKNQLEADLTTVADAIREKGGTSESLAFPEGMKSAVEAIEAGLDTTSSVPALATDIVGGKEAFVNGEKVIGSLRQTYANAYDWSLLEVEGLYGESLVQGTIELETSVTDDIIMRKGSYLGVRLPCSEFGDAKPEEVLSGKIFTSSSGYKKKGTYVPLNTSDATSTASDIVSGKTAYVNGVKITGNIAKKSAQTYTPTTSDQTISSGQYLDGAQTIKGDANLVSANIKKGATIFGVAGSFEGGPQVGAIVKAQAVSNVQIASGMSSRVNYGSTLTVSNGVVSISDSTSLTISAVSSLDVVKGKYIQPTASYGATTAVYFVPSTATFTQGGSTYSKTYTVSTVNEMFVYGGV